MSRSYSHKAFLIVSALLALCGLPATSSAKDISTNELAISKAPDWLKQSKVETVTDRIQSRLEWTIRKTPITFYPSQQTFSSVHGLGGAAIAVTRIQNGKASIHIGPLVTETNMEEVLGHELVHVIIYQKYEGSIPKWLEEGLANHFAEKEKVNYIWLASQPLPTDVKELAHPLKGSSAGVFYRYKASQAFAEMLDKKCDLSTLIRLSVKRKMEDYIYRYCEIKDLNAAFRDWVKSKTK